MNDDSNGPSLDERVRALIAEKKIKEAITLVFQTLGAEVFGFLIRAMKDESDADEVFALLRERVWHSIAKFRWQCTLRTWIYRIARNESSRFASGTQRRNRGRASFSELDNVVAAIRSGTQSIRFSEKLDKLKALRDELPIEDRTLLILNVDRDLGFKEIARIFLGETDEPTPEELKREAARLRKRFQLLKQRITKRAREDGLI